MCICSLAFIKFFKPCLISKSIGIHALIINELQLDCVCVCDRTLDLILKLKGLLLNQMPECCINNTKATI